MPSDGLSQDRRNLYYITRSGLAGGFAGCVVRLSPLIISFHTHVLLGKDGCRAPRQGQDPLSGVQSRFSEVRRYDIVP